MKLMTLGTTMMCAFLFSCATASVLNSNRLQVSPNARMREEIKCPPGYSKRVSATTYLELFATHWKDQPEPLSEADIEPAATKSRGQPQNLQRKKGSVLVFLLIGTQGQILETHVVCSTNPALDLIALEAAEEDLYRPEKIDGKPIISMIIKPYNFEP